MVSRGSIVIGITILLVFILIWVYQPDFLNITQTGESIIWFKTSEMKSGTHKFSFDSYNFEVHTSNGDTAFIGCKEFSAPQNYCETRVVGTTDNGCTLWDYAVLKWEECESGYRTNVYDGGSRVECVSHYKSPRKYSPDNYCDTTSWSGVGGDILAESNNCGHQITIKDGSNVIREFDREHSTMSFGISKEGNVVDRQDGFYNIKYSIESQSGSGDNLKCSYSAKLRFNLNDEDVKSSIVQFKDKVKVGQESNIVIRVNNNLIEMPAEVSLETDGKLDSEIQNQEIITLYPGENEVVLSIIPQTPFENLEISPVVRLYHDISNWQGISEVFSEGDYLSEIPQKVYIGKDKGDSVDMQVIGSTDSGLDNVGNFIVVAVVMIFVIVAIMIYLSFSK